MTGILEIPDETGHVTLSWDSEDPAEVDKVRAEFDRLKAAGYAFFTTSDETGYEVAALGAGIAKAGVLNARLVRPEALRVEPELTSTREFNPKKRRTIAVRPMRGG